MGSRTGKLGFVVGAASIAASAAALGMLLGGLSFDKALIFGSIIFGLFVGIDIAIHAVWG